MSDETFGLPEVEEEQAPLHTVADLERIVADCNKQIAMSMDENLTQKLREARDAAQNQLNELRKQPVETKNEGQWADLERAYGEFYGNKTEFSDCLKSLGDNRTAEVFETLRNKLARAHSLRDEQKPKRTRQSKKDKEKAAEVKTNPMEPDNTPESRWPHIVQHGDISGQNAQLIFDELGFSELTHEACNAVMMEINKRAYPNPPQDEVEEFGMPGEGSTPSATSAASPSPSTVVTQTPITSAIEYSIDPETGEVLDLPWILRKLGWTEFPSEPDKEKLAKIIDVINCYREPAARYREQAEKLAKPLEERAASIEKLLGGYIDACGAKFLPTYQSDSKPGVQKPHKKGDYSKKTLDVLTGSISWRKDGGPVCQDEGKFYGWLQRQMESYEHAKFQLVNGSPQEQEVAQALIADLEKTYQFRIEIKPTVNREFVKQRLDRLPDGWVNIEPNEFATRTIK